MRDVVTSIASARSTAVSILILLFVVPPRAHAATPQQRATKSDHPQTQSGADQRFLSALQAYKAGQYAAAQRQLLALVQTTPASFEINELLGLVYVAQGKPAQANPYLAKAVRLNANITSARTALATNLLALHRGDEAEMQFKKAVQLKPRDYDANHNLGEFYIQTGKIASAIPFLEHAQEADPAAYNNGYDLALALDETGRLDEARRQLQSLISSRDSAELHGLLGEVEEKSRNYLASAAQYEQAARMDPSEQNVLNWGAELLLHQTFAPAIEVFKAGTQRYPQSAPLQNGLGVALYGAGQMDDAARAFFRASDLTPSDALPLTFLGKACDGASAPLADQIRGRLQSFLARDAKNADVNYYLAACLWKRSPTDSNPDRDIQVESFLKRALAVNPNYADAHFQLGVLYADERKYPEATEEYERALKITPNSANTHYRLGQALARLGNDARAQEEFAAFERLRKNESETTDRERSQIQQFVYTIKRSDPNQ